ncbi:MAG: DEAD/DEAH box helicase [Leptolyngbyaceae cyanobacterium CRU_2_3]|nr:DEAD/DEAH box helicase [Leptolyngbyaceae cyanobacterium CRU_2_3]
MSFSDLGLSDEIVRAVIARGYTEPTPIQLQAIPAVLSGSDLLAGAQTGTGKTAGFTLPILHLLSANTASANTTSANTIKGEPIRRSPIRALILTPTRELAAQVEESVREYGRYLKLNSMAVFGGVNINPQIQRLKSRVDILVATPGRLLDHVQQRTVDLSRIEILVLDEADRMLDMGFIRDIRRILTLLPKQRQNLLFSATFSDEIKELAQGMMNRPILIEAARRNATADLVSQKVYPVNREMKQDLLAHLIKQHNWFQVLVFTRTKHGADRLSKHLTQEGIPALAIHGNKSQMVRTRTLAKFKDGSLQVLVATDIAARGIDISELPHVVNFELPHVPEDYVHRIGRTGRAGSEGEAVSLVCVDERKLLADIEKVIKRSLPQEVVAGFEPDPHAKPEPIQNGQNRRQRAQVPSRQSSSRGGAKPSSPRSDKPKLSSSESGEGKSRSRNSSRRSPSSGRR